MCNYKYTSFIHILVVCAVRFVVDAQPMWSAGYGRRLIGRGAGLHPLTGGTGLLGGHVTRGIGWAEGSALYPSGYDDSVLHHDGLTGLGGPIGGIGGVPVVPPAVPVAPAVPVVTDGGATVVDDRSGRTNVQLNIVNENNNVHDQAGANNVNVNQVSARNVNTCRESCGPHCIYPRVCVRNRDCPSNNQFECRTTPLGGGLLGGGLLGGGMVGGGLVGSGPMVGGPLGGVPLGSSYMGGPF